MPSTPRSPSDRNPTLARFATRSALVMPARNRLIEPVCSRTQTSPFGAISMAVALERPVAMAVSSKPGGSVAGVVRSSSCSIPVGLVCDETIFASGLVADCGEM